MIDLHSHTFLSDGELVPAEHIRRAEVAGYRVLGLSDHGDFATMESQIAAALVTAKRENELKRVKVLAGIELTHMRPSQIAEATAFARRCGAQFVIVHGQTLAEPVEEGTNRAAIEAGADILAHPGLITPEEAALAARKGVRLEISGRKGHCLSNGHVAATARATGAKVIFGSDSHDPDDFCPRAKAELICRAAGLSEQETQAMFREAEKFALGLTS